MKASSHDTSAEALTSFKFMQRMLRWNPSRKARPDSYKPDLDSEDEEGAVDDLKEAMDEAHIDDGSDLDDKNSSLDTKARAKRRLDEARDRKRSARPGEGQEREEKREESIGVCLASTKWFQLGVDLSGTPQSFNIAGRPPVNHDLAGNTG